MSASLMYSTSLPTITGPHRKRKHRQGRKDSLKTSHRQYQQQQQEDESWTMESPSSLPILAEQMEAMSHQIANQSSSSVVEQFTTARPTIIIYPTGT
jgi:hypothetical protein